MDLQREIEPSLNSTEDLIIYLSLIWRSNNNNKKMAQLTILTYDYFYTKSLENTYSSLAYMDSLWKLTLSWFTEHFQQNSKRQSTVHIHWERRCKLKMKIHQKVETQVMLISYHWSKIFLPFIYSFIDLF